MADFVQYGAVLTSPPPVRCEDLVTYSFLIETDDVEPLNCLCHRVFDEVSHGVVRCDPVGNFVVLQFSQSGWVGNPAIPTGVGETEVLIHVPVNYSIGDSDDKTPAFFTPYIWVNDSLSMAGGREVYGYPKGLGQFEIQGEPDEQSFTLKTLSGKTGKKFLTMQNLLVVKQGSAINSQDNVFDIIVTQYLGEKVRMVAKEAPHFEPAFVNLVGQWIIDGTLPELFFKQFRSSNTTEQVACFQQITTATYNLAPNSRKPKHKNKDYEYRLTLADFDSAPIHKDTGLVSGPLPEGCTQVYHEKLELSPTTVLWQAPVDRLPRT